MPIHRVSPATDSQLRYLHNLATTIAMDDDDEVLTPVPAMRCTQTCYAGLLSTSSLIRQRFPNKVRWVHGLPIGLTALWDSVDDSALLSFARLARGGNSNQWARWSVMYCITPAGTTDLEQPELQETAEEQEEPTDPFNLLTVTTVQRVEGDRNKDLGRLLLAERDVEDPQMPQVPSCRFPGNREELSDVIGAAELALQTRWQDELVIQPPQPGEPLDLLVALMNKSF